MTDPSPSVTTFWEQARRDPERAALVTDNGAVCSYADLAALANRFSNGFRDLGLVTGDTVALLMSNRVEFVAVMLATQQIGLTLAPLNRHLTPREIGYILQDSRARVLVADSDTAAAARAAATDVGLADDQLFVVGTGDGLRPVAELFGSEADPEHRTAGNRMFYTSGTTGLPKGVRQPLSGTAPEEALAFAGTQAVWLGLPPDGVYLSVGPLYHGAPYVHLLSALQTRNTVVLTSGFDPRRVLELIATHRVTQAFMVPTMMHRLLSVPAAERATFDVSSVQRIAHAAAMCPVHTKREMMSWFGPILVEYYGASEAGSVTIIEPEEWLTHPGSVGRARAGMHVEARDPETGAVLGPGEIGLLHMTKTFDFVYEGDAAKTASGHADGFFVPGDLGYLDAEGYLYIADRRTDLIISGGVNIYPAEVEAVLLEVPGVFDAVVFGVDDAEWGQVICALLVAADDTSPEALVASVRIACEQGLGKFKRPRILDVVAELPRNAAGKINRSRLRASFAAGTLDQQPGTALV